MDLLVQNNISFVIAVIGRDDFRPTGTSIYEALAIERRKFFKHDTRIENLYPIFSITSDLIDERLREGQGVLVHCRMGVNRSATIVIAYSMSFSHSFRHTSGSAEHELTRFFFAFV